MKHTLRGKQITIMHGHPYDTGAEGECDWNIKLVEELRIQLTDRGANVYVHIHKVMPYGERQRVMARAVRSNQPNCCAVLECHFNAYDGSAHGHEFLYADTPKLAECIQKRFSEAFPDSTPRGGGVKERKSGDGAGFLLKAPAASCITEPFFGDNKAEMDIFRDAHHEVAKSYVEGIEDFLSL